jgi:hypothetical protein
MAKHDVLRFLKQDTLVHAKDVAEHWEITEPGARAILHHLRRRGLVRQVWVLTDHGKARLKHFDAEGLCLTRVCVVPHRETERCAGMAVRSLKHRRAVSRDRLAVQPAASFCHHDNPGTDQADARFFARTIAVWQEPYGTTLTETEAREIARNMSQFFDILAEWDQASERSSLLHHPDKTNGGRA